jgi:4-carboxymuconolactone decarboxylase
MNPPPRLPPLADDDLPDAARAIVAAWPYKLHRTLAHSPATLAAWMPYAEHILRQNRLPPREREIAILRVAWNCASHYEWGLHERLARSLGFTEADVEAICIGAASPHWSAAERALVAGVDDLQTRWRIGDAAWAVLAASFTPDQLVDFVFVTGQFMLVAMALRSFDVQQEQGVGGLPAWRPEHTRAGQTGSGGSHGS